MAYFKEFLPAKKEHLIDVYTKALKYLKNANKGLKAGNVEEVQWWLGDLFILLCENKEVVINDVFGNDIFLGREPRLVFAGEESGGQRQGP